MMPPFYQRLNVRLFLTFASVLFVMANATVGQDIEKRQLDHVDYDRWSTITRQAISDDGKWVMYTVQNGAIDGVATTHIFNPDSGKRYSLERVSSATFTHGGQFAIYRVNPEKNGGVNSEKSGSQKPLLYCLELATGKTLSWAGVNSYATPKESGRWLACLLDAESMHGEVKPAVTKTATFPVGSEGLERQEKPLKLKSRKLLAEERGERELEIRKESGRGEERTNAEAESAARESVTRDQTDEKKTPSKNNGSPMLVVDLETGMQRVFPNVSSFSFSKDGSSLAWVTSVKKSQEAKASSNNDASVDAFGNDGVHLLRLDRFDVAKVMVGAGQYRSLTFSEDAKYLAFLSDHSNDDDAASASWSLYLTPTAKPSVKKVAHETVAGLPIGWWISESAPVRFSKDSQRLYFESKPIPATVLEDRKSNSKKQEAKDDSEKKMAKLDLWHWKDPQLQPQQLLQAEAEQKRTYKAAYVLQKKRVVQLETPTVPSVSIDERSTSTVAVANTNLPYRKSLSWDYPGSYDIYLVNLNDGTRRRVDQKVKWNSIMSPEGRYLAWFDGEKKQWYARSTRRGDSEPVLISRGIRQRLDDELHDTPNLPRPYGLAGWTTGDRFLIVYDRFDLWQLDLSGEKPAVCLTAGTGRKENVRYRYLPTDSEQIAIDLSQEILLTAFNERTKASGYAKLGPTSGSEVQQVHQLIMLDERLSGFSKASNADRVTFTRSTFRDFPDLWCSRLGFNEITRVSDVNPQQDEYSWGTSELVQWKAKDGQPLDGILLKPDDFDPNKKYPMLVYFYERNSDNLHRYYTPAAGRSIICHSFYVSRGYLVFIPDIPYVTGVPGPSAANAILPGVDHIVQQGFVHEDRIGLQGHSWGGYQTAYLVTQTDRFACAESGAPVSNMTSAYGGIRWGSGLSRMFQYERTQSRIGEDLWSARDKYVANSPLFYADQIHTPLLILHNDQDGAVPWYQGIELFVALRRLGRPAWMLNYNGEPHWVMDDYNRRDFARRMQQFFDHYLMNAPEPEWMAVGIPATQKGENDGFELLEPLE